VLSAPRWAAGLLGLVAWLGPATSVRAQAEPLAPGREVRLFVRGVAGSFDGRLTGLTPNALTLVQRDGSVFTLNPAQVDRSQVLGTRTNARRGALMGLGVGAGAGVWLAIASRNECLETSGFCDDPGDHFNEWHLVLPAVAGAAAGALVGHFIETPTWVPGFLPGAPSSDGFALSWTLPAGPSH
jgi:hypothetical protein